MKVVTIFLRVSKEELRKRLEQRIDKPSQEEMDLRLRKVRFRRIKKYKLRLRNRKYKPRRNSKTNKRNNRKRIK